MPGVIDSLNLSLPVKQYLKPLGLFRFWNRVDHGERGRVGPRRVLETEDAIVLHFCKKVHGLNEVGGGFAGKADDDVGRYRDGAAGGLDPGNALEVPLRGVFPGHEPEDAGRAGLDWQVYVVAESRSGVDGLDNVAGKVAGVAGGEANAANAGDFGDGDQELRKGALPFRVAIAVDVLAEELDLGIAEIGDAARLLENGR